jgi:2'-hydroxyisoflavone reductase
MRAMVEGVRKGVGSNVALTWVDDEFLKGQQVAESQFPLYAPPSGKTAGFHRCNIARALGKGLKFRPIADTARATLDWYQSLPADIQARVAPQFVKNAKGELWLDQEKRILAAWQASKKP